jgi:hypothetical protein
MFRRSLLVLLLVLCSLWLAPVRAAAQDNNPVRRGRKYKPPPETSHIEVLVLKTSNGKPITNAAVIFHSIMNGKDEGNLEVKSDPDGKATIDVIPTGSTLRLQVFADGFATFAEEYQIAGPEKHIAVHLLRPQEQISAYQDNSGKSSTRKPGVQDPTKPSAKSDTSKPPATPPHPAPLPPSERNTDAPVAP